MSRDGSRLRTVNLGSNGQNDEGRNTQTPKEIRMTKSIARQLIFAAPQCVAYEEKEIRSPTEGQIRVRAILSGISHGTEMTAFLGKAPFLAERFSPDRIFVPRALADPPFYPYRYAGYDWIGKVVEIGANAEGFAVGDRVFVPIPHQTECLLTTSNPEILRLKEGTRADDAIMVSLAAVAFNAAMDAEIKLGDVVAVFGGGMVGQLAVQIAFLNGAGKVFLVDPSEPRRVQAASLSPVETMDPSSEIPALAIKSRNRGKPPDVVIECSGTVKGLSSAIQAAGIGGTVVAAGFYAEPSTDLVLGKEFLHNRVTLKASMGVWGCPSRWPLQWDRARILKTVLELIESGKLKFGGCVSLRVPFDEAQRAYETIRDDPRHTKVVLTYE